MLPELQSGFRFDLSCITARVEVCGSMRNYINDNKVGFLIPLDNSEVFDSVDHLKLYTKVKRVFNFTATATKLVMSFISKKHQAVCTENAELNPLLVAKRVWSPYRP